MSSSSNIKSKSPTPPGRSAVVLLLADIASTTWRMFVPTVGGMSVGYFADKAYDTKPWLFVAGLVLGIVVAALLVTSQLKKS